MELVMDRRIIWDSCRKKEVEEAKTEIMAYKRRGYEIINADGSPMTRFTPALEEVIIRARQVGGHVLKILTEKGDERLIWDMNNGHEAIEAKKKFTELIAKGYKAYSVDSSGKKKMRISEFDVDAQEILMVPETVQG